MLNSLPIRIHPLPTFFIATMDESDMSFGLLTGAGVNARLAAWVL